MGWKSIPSWSSNSSASLPQARTHSATHVPHVMSDPLIKTTQHIDSLARQGTVLGRAYGFSFCGPSRSSLLSVRPALRRPRPPPYHPWFLTASMLLSAQGRLPMHVTQSNAEHPEDTDGPSLHMTLLPQLLQTQGCTPLWGAHPGTSSVSSRRLHSRIRATHVGRQIRRTWRASGVSSAADRSPTSSPPPPI